MKFTLEDAKFIESLMHNDYHGSTIYVFNSKFSYIFYMLFKFKNGDLRYKIKRLIDCFFTYKAFGTYTEGVEETHVYVFNLRKFQKGNEIWAFAQTVFHELRHYYQDKKRYNYYNEFSEADAIKFHMRMIDKEYVQKELDKYFGI